MNGRRRVALKYCGGCDPGYDRTQYFNRIRTAAAESIEWVTLHDRDFDGVLIINGCATACPERDIDPSRFGRVLSIRDGEASPESIVDLLLKRGEENENPNQGRLHPKP